MTARVLRLVIGGSGQSSAERHYSPARRLDATSALDSDDDDDDEFDETRHRLNGERTPLFDSDEPPPAFNNNSTNRSRSSPAMSDSSSSSSSTSSTNAPKRLYARASIAAASAQTQLRARVQRIKEWKSTTQQQPSNHVIQEQQPATNATGEKPAGGVTPMLRSASAKALALIERRHDVVERIKQQGSNKARHRRVPDDDFD